MASFSHTKDDKSWSKDLGNQASYNDPYEPKDDRFDHASLSDQVSPNLVRGATVNRKKSNASSTRSSKNRVSHFDEDYNYYSGSPQVYNDNPDASLVRNAADKSSFQDLGAYASPPCVITIVYEDR